MAANLTQFDVTEEASGDMDLVHASKNGDAAAFEQLVKRYDRKLLRIAQSVTHHREDSQDAVQEAFLKAYQHLADFREASQFSTWLIRITVNQSLMKLRKQRSTREMSLDEDFGDEGDFLPKEVTDWAPNPEQLYWASELIKTLEVQHFCCPIYGEPFNIPERESYRGEGATMARSAAASRTLEQVLQQANGICASRVKPLQTPDTSDATFS